MCIILGKERERMRSFLKLSSKLFIGSVVCIFVFVIGSVALNRLRGFQTKPDPILGTAISIPNVTSTPTSKPITPKTASGDPKIDCIGPDGKTFKTTKTECENFNAKWGKAPVNQVIPQPAQNTSGSTNTYTSKNYYSCTLCYHYSDENNCYTYNYLYETKEQCNAKQSEIDSLYTTTNTTNTVYQTPQPTVKPDYSYQNSQCKLGAKQWYDNQGTQCGGSCAQAIKQLALPEYQAKIAACNVQWPL